MTDQRLTARALFELIDSRAGKVAAVRECFNPAASAEMEEQIKR